MRKDKIRVPRDIKELTDRRIYKKVVLSIAFMVIVGVLLFLFGETVFGSFGSPSREILYAVLILAIPLSFGIPFSLIDRTWCGEITRVDIRTENTKSTVVGVGGIYTKYFVDIEIKLDSGKLIDRTVYEGRVPAGRQFNMYQIGDRVVHIYGTKYIQVVHKSESRPTVCVVCGTSNPPGERQCDSCGHTLQII